MQNPILILCLVLSVSVTSQSNAQEPSLFGQTNRLPAIEESATAEGLDIENPAIVATAPDQESTTTREIPNSLKLMLTLSVFSLAPALLMMTTCFVRFTIVTSLLKQAIGTPNIPPAQVMTSLSLFLTFLVMAPVWKQGYESGVKPYLEPPADQTPLTEMQAFERTMVPVREFMGGQIEQTSNQDAVWMFYEYQQQTDPTQSVSLAETETPQTYQELPLSVLLPAYLVSELKTAFLIGVQIFLPFLVIDLVVASVLTSSGMMMLPPAMVSLPMKLLLFVLIDGWHLIVGMLLESVRPLTG
ncbi:MAG: EscR/YscR/HrcR family type III secretion system export apparatus protein [Planctomycetaceae bacterium]|nr:EscR/YscR/HrcR family type III secretion system export apparatus protein [Planctomycetaceae bacterium]